MSREWFDKRPGEPPMRGEPDGSVATLLGDTTPDVVRLPPNLGGRVVRVVGTLAVPCPKGCGAEHRALTLDARTPGDNGSLGVAECSTHGEYLWFRIPDPDPSEGAP